eukprot:6212546-Pleurochrysis_carterae.AAC.3
MRQENRREHIRKGWVANTYVLDQVVLEEPENVRADSLKLILHLALVCRNLCLILTIWVLFALPLLDRSDDAQRSTASTDNVLVSDREEIALLQAQIIRHRLGNLLHVLDHFLIALSLLGELGHVLRAQT